MKKEKIENIFIRFQIIFIFLLAFASIFVGTSLSKYVFKENISYNDQEKIDFTVNSVFVVNTAEELFTAINQGYTYVQLDKNIENPLIITQKAENLNNDLILDLNGIEIQRNGYEPILNINEGIRLTIVDSSDEQTGGLYNPVGSVFNIKGGILTVITGFFESGPRYSEYYTYNNLILNNDNNSLTKRTIVENNAQTVNFYDKNGSYEKTAPIIKSYPTKTGDIKYNHGNLYFDETITRGNVTINADTYCYYRTSEDATLTETDNSMADWYYTYYVDFDTYEYTGIDAQSSSDIEVTIYGYENVIEQASNILDSTEYYAAIQMSSGELDVQEGAFYQYFGVDTTACVNSYGGTININHGTFSSRVPNATKYDVGNTYVKESDKDAFNINYFDNFNWYNTSSNGLAKKGESYCILNGGSAVVKIGNGKLYSSNNNIISMQGGELAITGGEFTKNITNNVDDTNSNISYSAINMQNGSLLVKDSTFDVVGDNTYAIYSMISGNDNFNVTNTDIKITGDNTTGIYSSRGEVTMHADKEASVSIDGNSGIGICVENGGSVTSENYSYYLNGDTSYGIYSTSGTINMNGGNVYLLSNNNCYGIFAASTDLINIDVNNIVVAIGCNVDSNNQLVLNAGTPEFKETTKTGTVKASVGVFLSSQNTSSKLSITNSDVYSYELGLVSNGGTIELNETGNIITDKASAIAIKTGNIIFKKNSEYVIVSNNTTSTDYENTYTLTLPVRTSTSIVDTEYVNTDGIYVNGGSFESYGNLNLTHTGLQNKTFSSYDYTTLVVTSYAVRVYGGDVTIEKGTIKANIGGGIYSGKSKDDTKTKGKVVLGSKDSLTSNTIEVYTLGNKVGSEYNAIGVNLANWKSYQSITGGHAVELDGGNIIIYNGYYEAQFGNGIFVNGSDSNTDIGEIIVYNGEFYGYMNNNKNISMSTKSGPAAYYGLKVIGGSIVKIYDGTFGGGNGGAFVTGVTKINSQKIQSSSTANVYIYKGTFGSKTGSQDAFNVYDDVNIVFGAYTEEELNNYSSVNDIQQLIVLNAINASVAANCITNNYNSHKKSNILIYYGTYNGSSSINMYLDPYFGSCSWKTYNTNANAGPYTHSNGSTQGNQNNTSKQYFSGSFQ